MKTIITAHRAIITRAIIALFVLTSIAATSPVDALLGSIAAQIEQRAMVEANYANMATIQLRSGITQAQDNVDSLMAIQQFYSGRASAMVEVAAYLRSFRSGDIDTPIVP